MLVQLVILVAYLDGGHMAYPLPQRMTVEQCHQIGDRLEDPQGQLESIGYDCVPLADPQYVQERLR